MNKIYKKKNIYINKYVAEMRAEKLNSLWKNAQLYCLLFFKLHGSFGR